MDRKKQGWALWLVIGAIVLGQSGALNKVFMGDWLVEPQAISATPYDYKQCSGSGNASVCETKFIPCTTNADCSEVCLGDTTYRWIADQVSHYFNETYLQQTSYYVNDIKGSYCGTGHCYVSEYCLYSGAAKEYILNHPWAWVQEHPVYALAIGAGIVVFLII